MTYFFMCEYPSNLCLNLIPKPAGEPVFLVFSKHITSWYNNDRDEGKEYTQVEVAYPRWKFLPQSSINYIIQGKNCGTRRGGKRHQNPGTARRTRPRRPGTTREEEIARPRPTPATCPSPWPLQANRNPQAKYCNCSEGQRYLEVGTNRGGHVAPGGEENSPGGMGPLRRRLAAQDVWATANLFFSPREYLAKCATSLLGMQEPRGTSLPFMVIST